MQFFEKIQKLNNYQKWVLVAGTFLLALAACYVSAQQNMGVFSCLFLFYVPLTLSVVLLGLNAAAVLTVLVLIISILNLMAVSAPFWTFVTYVPGLVVNYWYWHQWVQKKELQEFQFQKYQDELELN